MQETRLLWSGSVGAQSFSLNVIRNACLFNNVFTSTNTEQFGKKQFAQKLQLI